ncbi:GNAT family N-acetyltransferase [Paenibacillus abyssi]|uniref:GNAT family N-acetyltransferase n=1 Tax=Paenibacillus abyssi TaxID=1340531 RepID=UPI001665C0A1|nr:GNAT family N-acetyltransferase [Paenibacillus abyssi]
MIVKILTPEEWRATRYRLTAFAIRHGDRRLTLQGLSALRSLDPDQLAQEGLYERNIPNSGSVVAVTLQHGKPVGFAAAVDCGQAACLLVVRPDARGQGIAGTMMKAMIERCGQLVCHVAADNPASMAACFRAGMVAVGLSPGPTGKPTLQFEGRASGRSLNEGVEAWPSPASVF